MATTIEFIDVGIMPYEAALRWQRRLADRRRQKKIGDQIMLLEHPPVYTFGRRDASGDLLVTRNWLQRHGMEVIKTDRGGKVTYHGPGQLVAYFIFAIKQSIPDFVRCLEEIVIRLLARYRIEGERRKGFPGVWIDDRKIAALGLHIDRGISTHGFSLNVNCDLKPFRYIHPCGLTGVEVTSLERELGWNPSMRDVKHLLLEEFTEVFKASVSLGGARLAPPE